MFRFRNHYLHTSTIVKYKVLPINCFYGNIANHAWLVIAPTAMKNAASKTSLPWLYVLIQNLQNENIPKLSFSPEKNKGTLKNSKILSYFIVLITNENVFSVKKCVSVNTGCSPTMNEMADFDQLYHHKAVFFSAKSFVKKIFVTKTFLQWLGLPCTFKDQFDFN